MMTSPNRILTRLEALVSSNTSGIRDPNVNPMLFLNYLQKKERKLLTFFLFLKRINFRLRVGPNDAIRYSNSFLVNDSIISCAMIYKRKQNMIVRHQLILTGGLIKCEVVKSTGIEVLIKDTRIEPFIPLLACLLDDQEPKIIGRYVNLSTELSSRINLKRRVAQSKAQFDLLNYLAFLIKVRNALSFSLLVIFQTKKNLIWQR